MISIDCHRYPITKATIVLRLKLKFQIPDLAKSIELIDILRSKCYDKQMWSKTQSRTKMCAYTEEICVNDVAIESCVFEKIGVALHFMLFRSILHWFWKWVCLFLVLIFWGSVFRNVYILIFVRTYILTFMTIE